MHVYAQTVEQMITRGLLEHSRKLTSKGKQAVIQSLPTLEKIVVHTMETLGQVVSKPTACEQDTVIYMVACILWKEWNDAQKTKVRELSSRTNMHASALPILAGAYVVHQAVESGIIGYNSQNMLNLERERTKGYGRGV